MTEEKLRAIVSKLMRVDYEKIDANTPLTGTLGGSLGRARLDAALRAESVIFNPSIYRISTYGSLCKAIGMGSSSLDETLSVTKTSNNLRTLISSASGIQIGVDVEAISALPTVPDYWEDEFYKRTFTAQEIAYALLQSSPKASFAAIWCAKESLRKANPALATVDWQRLEVVHAPTGKPDMVVDGEAIGGVISLSHTDEFALAVFVRVQPAPRPSVAPAPLPPESVKLFTNGSSRPEIVAIFAMLISILALLLTLTHH